MDHAPGDAADRPSVLLVLLLVLVTGLVGLSPLGLGLFMGGKDEWERLSFIGQTYGAASAVLSALALVGIAITLVLQAREVKVGREQGQRLLHVDLLKMAMENPLYRRAWGPSPPGRDPDADLQQIYVNLIISEWQTSFELRTMDEDLLRAVATTLFRGEPGRRFWAEARDTRLAALLCAQRLRRSMQAAFRNGPEPSLIRQKPGR
ncbi:DUF6082 family protein [Actinomadura adrarensis]|uniref:DUF6082 family protein n=1 Tax=Actinomadura adrarensis TaxID=1819600 RepID=A0ABW3C9V5_9ACTN